MSPSGRALPESTRGVTLSHPRVRRPSAVELAAAFTDQHNQPSDLQIASTVNTALAPSLKGATVAWVSSSVQSTLGEPPEKWIGSDFSDRIRPAESDKVLTVLQQIVPGQVIERFRVKTVKGAYHWVDGHCKSYLNADGDPDGVIVALRIVDDQVEAQRRREQMAKFDAVTGLANHAEAMARFESALSNPRCPGAALGVLFCDIDHFKGVNDRWGHSVGDAVLATVAERIRECVRREDTVGRLLIDKEILSRQRAEAHQHAAEAERERAEAQALYRIILEAAPDAMIIVGPDGRIMIANAETTDYSGMSARISSAWRSNGSYRRGFGAITYNFAEISSPTRRLE
ncbi:MAG: diguanylate cyclase domain-containing protein [Mycobacterium sp.]